MKIAALPILLTFASSGIADEAQRTCTNPDVTITAVNAALEERDALYNLAVEFYTGRCLEQSYANAAVLWQKATDKGSLGAQSNLAYLTANGLGVSKDEPKAAQLWLAAAMKGHVEAQVHFGEALFYGSGVPQDRERGLAWVLLAIDNAMTAPNNPEGGGGARILKMAEDSKTEMLAEAPDLFSKASIRIRDLLDTPNGR